MSTLVQVLKALADTTRLRILASLHRAATPLCICEIVDALQVPQYSVSKHMKELRHAGVVQERRTGRFMFYALRADDTKCAALISAAIAVCDDPLMKKDAQRLRKRLAARKDGACVGVMGGVPC